MPRTNIITQKLVDTSADLSKGGRAQRYWQGKPVVANSSSKAKIGERNTEINLKALVDKYKLKGIEYGNWLSNNERYDKTIAFSAAMVDLAKIFGSDNLGLDYLVGIAFGARGMSKANAHYEPRTNMINLTKENGDGSFSHEYAHALDYNLGRLIDQHKFYNSLSGDRSTSDTLPDNVGGQLRYLVNKIIDTIKTTDSYARLENAEPYWHSRTEIFARAFEQYIAWVNFEKKIYNIFLCRTFTYYTQKPQYLKAKDFDKVHPLFRRLTKEISLFMRNQNKVKATPYPIIKITTSATTTKTAANKPKAKSKPKTVAKPKPKATQTALEFARRNNPRLKPKRK